MAADFIVSTNDSSLIFFHSLFSSLNYKIEVIFLFTKLTEIQGGDYFAKRCPMHVTYFEEDDYY